MNHLSPQQKQWDNLQTGRIEEMRRASLDYPVADVNTFIIAL